MIEKNTYRTVDIFKEAPSEKTPQDSLSLEDLVDQDIERAIKLVGKRAFKKRVKELKSLFLSRRDEKMSVGRAEPLNESSFLIAAAYSIIRKNDQKSKTTPPR